MGTRAAEYTASLTHCIGLVRARYNIMMIEMFTPADIEAMLAVHWANGVRVRLFSAKVPACNTWAVCTCTGCLVNWMTHISISDSAQL